MIRRGRFGTIHISESFITNGIMTTIATDDTTKKTIMDEITTGETTEANMTVEANITACIAARKRLDVDSECADATPSNVGKNIASHFPRMALTRAKDRCLRDALNIGMVALEELGDVAEDNSSNGARREPFIPAGAANFDYRQR